MKYSTLYGLIWIIAAGCATNKIILPEAFLNNSAVWSAKVKDAIFTIPKSSFGPYAVIDTYKKNTGDRSKDNKNDLIFWHTTTVKNGQQVRLQLAYANSDTATAACFLTNVIEYEGTTLVGSLLGFKDNNQAPATYKYPTYLKIYTASDSLVWKKNTDPYPFCGWLQFGSDSFLIKSIYSYQKKSGIIKTMAYCQGIQITEKDITIAAVQFTPKAKVWIADSLADNKKKMLGFYMVTFLSLQP